MLGVAERAWDRMTAGPWDGVLSQDQLIRASTLIGMFKGLHLLFADGMADRWPRLSNRAPMFERQPPIAAQLRPYTQDILFIKIRYLHRLGSGGGT